MVLGSTLPVSTPALAPSDLALLSDGGVRTKASNIRASLSDPLLAEWQESTRRALEYVSIVETLLTSVSRSVFGDASEQPKFSDEADPSEVASLLHYAGTSIHTLTECLSSTHTNFALARRDALLLQPNQATPAAMRSSLRTLPLVSDSLFGSPSAEFLRSAQQAKQEEFVFKAATAALLPQPKPWGLKTSAPKRKASHPLLREDSRMPTSSRYDPVPSSSFPKQIGWGRVKRDRLKPSTSRG